MKFGILTIEYTGVNLAPTSKILSATDDETVTESLTVHGFVINNVRFVLLFPRWYGPGTRIKVLLHKRHLTLCVFRRPS